MYALILHIYVRKHFWTENFLYFMNMLIENKNISEQMLIKKILKTVYL